MSVLTRNLKWLMLRASLNPRCRQQASQQAGSPGAVTTHRCLDCREQLASRRQHTSPPRLGPPLTTEHYDCPACGAAFVLTRPADGSAASRRGNLEPHGNQCRTVSPRSARR